MAKVSKRLRFEILRRDNYQCRYCGAKPPETELRVDHVVPETLGGRAEADNLVAACVDCNAGKSSIAPDAPLVDDVRQDALRWMRALQIAATGQRVERDERDANREAFKTTWDGWTYQHNGQPSTVPMPIDWNLTIDAFVCAGLDEEDMADAIDITMRKTYVLLDNKFKYFCGVCWGMINSRRDTAAILAPLVDLEAGQEDAY